MLTLSLKAKKKTFEARYIARWLNAKTNVYGIPNESAIWQSNKNKWCLLSFAVQKNNT
jgi:hypothetical protein